MLQLTDRYGDLKFRYILSGGAVAVVMFMAICGTIITIGMRSYGRGACSTFAHQTGFKTKFAVIGWADSGTCLARTPDGRWVLNTKVFQYVNGNK